MTAAIPLIAAAVGAAGSIGSTLISRSASRRANSSAVEDRIAQSKRASLLGESKNIGAAQSLIATSPTGILGKASTSGTGILGS